MEKHENVTEIDFDVAGFSRHYVSEDGNDVFYFYVEKGIERGIIGVTGENNQMVGIWHDNPNYVETLDECTTICSPRILTLVGITPMLADIEGSLNDKMDLCGGIYNIGESISMGYSVLNEILNGKRPVTTTSALMFEAALDIPADSLLKLQMGYNLHTAQKDNALKEKLKQIRKVAAML